MKYLFEGNYSIYMEVTYCDSKGDIKKGLDRIDLICDEEIYRALSAYKEYYTVLSWEIWVVPKRYK